MSLVSRDKTWTTTNGLSNMMFLVKLPFPLTPQFKAMLQSGVGTRDLDVRWVSSLSWYFLTLFGLQPVYNFILGSNNGELLIIRASMLVHILT